jgi:hypothetical protein
MFCFTDPSSGQISKHSTSKFSECTHYVYKLFCKQYGIPHCAHDLNVPVQCFDIWPDDGSVNRNMSLTV